MNVRFPAKTTQRYYETHYRYVLNILQYAGCAVDLAEIPSGVETLFTCEIDGQWVAFDFSDAGLWRSDSDIPLFKFHHRRDESYRNVFPFTPVSFYDWDTYYFLRDSLRYEPAGRRRISARQRPYGNATERRQLILGLLAAEFGADVVTDLLPQLEYWEDIEEIRLAVFVPGQNNNMLDRGHLQYLALGAGTLSPALPELLPYRRVLAGCYLTCSDDYGDLAARIRAADDASLAEAGMQARQLFAETSTPERLVAWIEQCLNAAQAAGHTAAPPANNGGSP